MVLTYKFIKHGEIRKRVSDDRFDYQQLKSVASYLHSVPVSDIIHFQYIDNDGDNITLTTDDELACAYDEFGDVFTFTVVTATSPTSASINSPVYSNHVSFAEPPSTPAQSEALPALEDIIYSPLANTRQSLDDLVRYLDNLSQNAVSQPEKETYEHCKKLADRLRALTQNPHISRVHQLTHASIDTLNMTFNSLIRCAKEVRDVLTDGETGGILPRTSSRGTPPLEASTYPARIDSAELLLPVQGPPGR